MKISIKDSAIDLGCILLLHTIVIATRKRVERQAVKAEKVGDVLTLQSCNMQLEQFDVIVGLLGEIAKQEWEQTTPKNLPFVP